MLRIKNTCTDQIGNTSLALFGVPNTPSRFTGNCSGVTSGVVVLHAANMAAMAKAAFFVNSHIIQGRVFVDDNKKFLYPANANSLNRALVPVLAKVNNERLGLTNQSLLIEVSKSTSSLLNWLPQNVLQGTKVLVSGKVSGTMRVQRGKPTGTSIPNNYRSNRIACKAILHEVNNYFSFQLN